MTSSPFSMSSTGQPDGTLSRRTFLAGAAAVAGFPYIVPAGALGKNGRAAASERITIGVIGTGSRGINDLDGLMNSPLSQIVAVCDCRQPRLEAAKARVDKFYADQSRAGASGGCKAYHDFREVIDRKDIDVIQVTTPDHWHGIVATRALAAGKDLYCEKPLGRTIAESIAIRDAAHTHKRVFQTGTQQRSDAKFRQAVALARGGYLGKLQTIEVAVPAGGDMVKEPTCPVPPGFDYDMWTGPAPMHPFDAKRCEWLAMYWIADYCVGFICNWGIHHLDIAAWGCPEVAEAPFELEGTGFLPTQGMCSTIATWRCMFRFPSGLTMSFTSDKGPFDWQKNQGLTPECSRHFKALDLSKYHETGCRFIGSEGWVHVTRGAISAEPASLLTRELDPAAHGIVVSDDHYVNFLEAVRDRREPVSPVASGHRATVLGNAADIAVRLGKKLKWDPREEKFVGDDEANKRLAQPMRAPWRLG
jgi:Oxidoreductase family, NAD-binding Rossmann fold/Oxidoreductase family, C-terminal alpha/beta domain